MTTYTVETKSNGDLDGLADRSPGPPTLTTGSRQTYRFDVPESQGDRTFSSDYTVPSGTTEIYDAVTVDGGVTLTVNGTLKCESLTVNGTVTVDGEVIVTANTGNFSLLLDYGEWAGSYSQLTMLDGTEKYRQRIPDGESVDSIVFGIEPGSGLTDVEGVWALVERVADERNPALANNTVAVEVRVLAPLSDYTDHADLEADLQL